MADGHERETIVSRMRRRVKQSLTCVTPRRNQTEQRTECSNDASLQQPSNNVGPQRRRRVYKTVGRPSVCLSVHNPWATCSSRQEILIDCCTAHSSAAVQCHYHVVSVRSSCFVPRPPPPLNPAGMTSAPDPLQYCSPVKLQTKLRLCSAGLTMWQMWQMPRASGLRGAPEVDKKISAHQ